MTFDAYPKIQQNLRDLPDAVARKLAGATWVATEKIHGANFCVLFDGQTITCAKRKAVIPESETFFSHRRAIAPHLSALARVWDTLADHPDHPHLTHIAIYGELFGGHYPHPDVPPVADVYPVQTGVAYCPDIRWMPFDILCTRQDHTAYWLDFDTARDLMTQHDLPWSPALLRGSMTDVLEMPTSFTSTIPHLFSLPSLPSPNLAEGVVIRPVQQFDVRDTRPVIKRKMDAFAEDERYHQATRWPQKPAHEMHFAHDRAMHHLEQRLSAMLNPPRVDAARSKIGHPTGEEDPRYAEITREVERDILADLLTEDASQWLAISAQEQALLTELLRGDIAHVCAQHLLGD